MADGKVVIQVDMDGNKAQSGMSRLKNMVGGLSESGAQLGSVFKSVLGANIVSGALISGIQSLGSAMKGVFSTALDEGAKLQQSFGGIDTLYKGAEDTMKQYATAAAAAGISANTYAEQAVSFGASLKKALGGDAVKAAEAANKAILSMADNSAKMGTDIGSIQMAFQGFAKGNYTMLDNLKLGYGGTQQEMKRLLADASKLEKAMGKKFDINNFADIVEAIDLVQQELGIAGVAAEEAKTTFSGSFEAMKASASNFLANLTLGEDIGPSLKSLISTTSTFLLGNFVPMVGNIMRQLPQAVEVALAEAGPKIEQGFKSLFSSLGVDEGVFDVVKDTFRDVVVTIQSLFESFTSEGNGFKDLLQGISNVITFVNAVIQELARGFQLVVESFANTGAINSAYSALKNLSGAAVEVAKNLGEAIPWSTIGSIAGQVVNFISLLVSWFSKLAQSISPEVWQTLIVGVTSFVVALKGLKTGLSVAKGLKSAFDFGKNLVSLITNTLSLTAAQATNAAASTAMSAGNTAVGTSAGAAASSVLKLGAGILMIGAGVLLAASGIYLLVQAAIQLSSAGAGAILTMVGLGVGIAALAVVFTFLGPALTAGAVGILAFGAAVALIGVGVYAASVGLALLAVQLPVISTYGLSASIALAALGASMLVLGAGALVAGAGLLVLGAGALAAGAGVLVFGAGLLVASVGVAAFGVALALVGVGVYTASAGLSMLAGHLPTIATYGAGAAIGIAALGAGLLVMGAGALVAGAGALVLGAGLLTAGAGATVFGAGMLVAAAGVAAFGLALGLCAPSITTFAEAISKIIETLSSGLSSILQAIASVIQSIGDAALNAGLGFKSLAEGVVMITNTGLADLSASLAATAAGLGAIASQGAGLAIAGQGMTMLSSGMMMLGQSTVILQSALIALPALLTSFTSSLTGLPAVLTATASSMTDFGSNVQSSLTGLTGLGEIVIQFNAMLMTIAPATMMASTGLASFNAQATLAGNSMQILGTSSAAVSAQIASFGLIIASAMMGATTATNVAGGQMVATIRTTGIQMISAEQSCMSQIVSAVKNGMNNAVSTIRNGGSQMVSAMQSALNQMKVVVQNTMNSIVSSIQSHGGQMVSAWETAGQQMITTTQSFVNNANSSLKGIGSGVNLYSNGAALMSGLKSGIDAGWSRITSSVSNMAQWIKDHKGPVSYDRKLLIENGSAIMAGLNQGIQTGWRKVMDNISNMAGTIQDVINDDYSNIGWQIGLGISDGLNSSQDKVAGYLDAIRNHVNDFSLKSKNLLTGATATMSSQLKVEALRGKTPKDETSSRQEAYIAHSTSLLSDVIDGLSELREQVAQGQTMVLDTGALIGGTAYAYDEAVGNIQTLRGRHRL
jgi:putative phage tail protein